MANKFKWIILSVFFSFIFAPALALADGAMFSPPDRFADRWDLVRESGQNGFISYRDGIERLIISVDPAQAVRGAAWVLPVPAAADKVEVAVATVTPVLEGEGLGGAARGTLYEAGTLVYGTQLYTFLYVMERKFGSFGRQYESDGYSFSLGAAGGDTRPVERDVVVHSEISQAGMIAQVISAKSAQGISEHLKGYGIALAVDSLPALNSYIGKKYSFIISWLEGGEKAEARGLALTFPTDRIYFPLHLTSLYGNDRIPVMIRVLGHVKPKVFSGIRRCIDTKYYINEYYNEYQYKKIIESGNGQKRPIYSEVPAYIEDFFGPYAKSSPSGSLWSRYQDLEGISYTKVTIDAPAKAFTDDLWFKDAAPWRTYIAHYIRTHPLAVAIIIIILSSFLAGILSGLTWFRRDGVKKAVVKHGLLGLSNCLSLAAYDVAVRIVLPAEPETVGPPTKMQRFQAVRGSVFAALASALLIFIALISTEEYTSLSFDDEVFIMILFSVGSLILIMLGYLLARSVSGFWGSRWWKALRFFSHLFDLSLLIILSGSILARTPNFLAEKDLAILFTGIVLLVLVYGINKLTPNKCIRGKLTATFTAYYLIFAFAITFALDSFLSAWV